MFQKGCAPSKKGSPLMPINCLVNQRDKKTKSQRDEGTKKGREEERKRQSDKRKRGKYKNRSMVAR